MEVQKLRDCLLNWLLSKPIQGITSVLDFDLLRKAKGIDPILGLVLVLHSV